MATCRDCGGLIRFVLMPSGKHLPCDEPINPAGNVAAQRRGRTFAAGRVMTATTPLQPGEVPFLAHHASCVKRTKRTTTKAAKPSPQVRKPEPLLF